MPLSGPTTRSLLAALADPDRKVRLQACAALVHTAGDPAVVAKLSGLLADKDIGTAAEAALDAVGPGWRRAPETLDLLRVELRQFGRALAVGHEHDDWPAAVAPAPLPPATAPLSVRRRRLLFEPLEEEDEAPPVRPARPVGPPAASPALSSLLCALGDRVALLARMTAEEEEPAVRRAAFELLLAQSDPGRALRLATAHLDDPQPPLRLRALQAAVKLDPASGLSHALRAANDPAPEVRAFVARFCASRDEPEARRCLQALVDDAADSVRLTAKDRLGLVAEPAPPDLQPSVTLADALADPRREVRADAVRVLASESETAGDRAPLLERVLLEETDADLRLDALSSPGGAAAAVAVLQALLRDPDPRMRARAAQHLGQRQAAETIGDLTARLTDSGAEVRACARAALDRIDPEWAGREAAQRREPEIVEALTQAMPEVRAAAAAALALIAEARTERPTRQPESARTNR